MDHGRLLSRAELLPRLKQAHQDGGLGVPAWLEGYTEGEDIYTGVIDQAGSVDRRTSYLLRIAVEPLLGGDDRASLVDYLQRAVAPTAYLAAVTEGSFDVVSLENQGREHLAHVGSLALARLNTLADLNASRSQLRDPQS